MSVHDEVIGSVLRRGEVIGSVLRRGEVIGSVLRRGEVIGSVLRHAETLIISTQLTDVTNCIVFVLYVIL
jgi:hypothetical protein